MAMVARVCRQLRLLVTVDPLPTVATILTTPLDYCGTLESGSLGGNNPVTGTGAWSIIDGGTGTFSNSADGNSTFTADATGTYVLRWTDKKRHLHSEQWQIDGKLLREFNDFFRDRMELVLCQYSSRQYVSE